MRKLEYLTIDRVLNRYVCIIDHNYFLNNI